MIRTAITIAMTLGLTTGCGTKESHNDAPTAPPLYEGPSFSLVGANNTNWQSVCKPVEKRENRSYRVTVSFSEPRFVITETYFDGLDCQDGLRRVTFRYKYYNVKKEDAELLAGWTTIAYQVEAVTLELHRETLVLPYNENSNYGYNDWSVGVEKDVSGRQFNANEDKELERNATRERTFQIKDDQLFFAKYDGNVPVANSDFVYDRVP